MVTEDTKMPQRTLRNVVIDAIEPEFVVFIVVLRELRDLVFYLFHPYCKLVRIIQFGFQINDDKVGIDEKFKRKI